MPSPGDGRGGAMRVMAIRESIGPDGLFLEQRPMPVPGPREVRVAVVATAVNRADLLQSLGKYPAPIGAPADVPGLEFAGVVSELGAECTQLTLGERVMGIVAGGSYAEHLVVDERLCVRVPAGMPLAVAGALPEALVTVHDALVTRGGLQGGMRLLVHAATSGIGTMAVKLGRALGAEVWASTRRASASEPLREIGADHVLLVGDQGLEAAVAEAKIAGTVHVILELVGAAYLPGDLQAIRTGGAIVVVGTLGHARAEFELGTLMRKRACLHGTVLRSRTIDEKITATHAAFSVAERVGLGALQPVIAARFALADAADAHRRVLLGDRVGRVAIDVAPEGFLGETTGDP